MNMFDWIRTATTIYKNGKLVGRGDISGSGWWVVPGCKARMENGDVIEVRVVIEIGGKEYTFVVPGCKARMENGDVIEVRVVIEIGGKEYTFVVPGCKARMENGDVIEVPAGIKELKDQAAYHKTHHKKGIRKSKKHHLTSKDDFWRKNMEKITVVNEVREYPDDNKEYHTMKIRNHWNFRDRVVIEIGGKEYTFVAEHIEKALRNATNAH